MAIQTRSQTASIIYEWPEQGEWTYEDYARLPDDGRRYEIIGGKLHVSPAPSTSHQDIVLGLAATLRDHVLKAGIGKAYVAPIDVVIPDLTNPVQPDILFIAQDRLAIVQKKYIAGVPDLIVEVLSPGNPGYDRYTKYRLYEAAGVKEYWVVDPDDCIVDVYVHYEETYVPHGHFERGGVIQSKLLPDLRIPLDDICQS